MGGNRKGLQDESGPNGPLGVLRCSPANRIGLGGTGHRLGIISGRPVGIVSSSSSSRGPGGGGGLGVLSGGDRGKLRPAAKCYYDGYMIGYMIIRRAKGAVEAE